MLAFGFTAYDSNQEPIDDPDYGELKAYFKTWGFGPPGVFWEELNTIPCTEEMLKYKKDSSLFYPSHKDSTNDLHYYRKKLQCFDKKTTLRI